MMQTSLIQLNSNLTAIFLCLKQSGCSQIKTFLSDEQRQAHATHSEFVLSLHQIITNLNKQAEENDQIFLKIRQDFDFLQSLKSELTQINLSFLTNNTKIIEQYQKYDQLANSTFQNIFELNQIIKYHISAACVDQSLLFQAPLDIYSIQYDPQYQILQLKFIEQFNFQQQKLYDLIEYIYILVKSLDNSHTQFAILMQKLCQVIEVYRGHFLIQGRIVSETCQKLQYQYMFVVELLNVNEFLVAGTSTSDIFIVNLNDLQIKQKIETLEVADNLSCACVIDENNFLVDSSIGNLISYTRKTRKHDFQAVFTCRLLLQENLTNIIKINDRGDILATILQTQKLILIRDGNLLSKNAVKSIPIEQSQIQKKGLYLIENENLVVCQTRKSIKFMRDKRAIKSNNSEDGLLYQVAELKMDNNPFISSVFLKCHFQNLGLIVVSHTERGDEGDASVEIYRTMYENEEKIKFELIYRLEDLLEDQGEEFTFISKISRNCFVTKGSKASGLGMWTIDIINSDSSDNFELVKCNKCKNLFNDIIISIANLRILTCKKTALVCVLDPIDRIWRII